MRLAIGLRMQAELRGHSSALDWLWVCLGTVLGRRLVDLQLGLALRPCVFGLSRFAQPLS